MVNERNAINVKFDFHFITNKSLENNFCMTCMN